jgi:hypothetical protein
MDSIGRERNPSLRDEVTVRMESVPRRSRARVYGGVMATDEELRAELERLKAENEALKSRRTGATSMKVSEKGGLSVYGLGRFPVTLYQEQWLKLLDLADQIRAFIREHQSELKKRE